MLKMLYCDMVWHPADRKYTKLEGGDCFQLVNPDAVTRMWQAVDATSQKAHTFVEMNNCVILHSPQDRKTVMESLTTHVSGK